MTSLSAAGLAVLAAFLALAACDRPPAADTLPEWTPADHHSSDDDKLPAGAKPTQVEPATRGALAAAGGEIDQLTDIAWRQQCSTCHGPGGRGDGQMGPMVSAPDLSREDWQSRVTDAEIASAIKNGKGKMPAFNVPGPVLQGLVARVRALRER